MSKKSIIIIGPFPPPIGGVSIHIIRLVSRLKDRYKVFEIDTSKNRFVQGIKLLELFIRNIGKSSKLVVHNHVFRPKFNFIVVYLCKIFGAKYIQTIHSFRQNTDNLSKNEVWLIKFINNYSSKIIVVSDKIKDDLFQLDEYVLQKIEVIPAFIPYEGENSIQELSQYIDDLQIKSFMNSHRIILCANAYKIAFYNNEDLYGIDLCIELIKKIIYSANYNVGLIFMLPQVGDIGYFNLMKNRIIEYGIEEDFVFVNKEIDLVPLFEYVDIFLRPTNTDGDALSIREALFSGVPTIASDIVERPVGTIIFRNRDVSDLYEKVITVIENIEEEKNKTRELSNLQEDLIKKYFSIYN